MITDFKIFESRFKPDSIDKKFYVWKRGSYSGGSKGYPFVLSLIEIIESKKNGDIIYKTLLHNLESEYWDVLTGKKAKMSFYNNQHTISISYWKRNKSVGLLYETDKLQDGIDFYNMYFKDQTLNRENFEMKRDSNKFGI